MKKEKGYQIIEPPILSEILVAPGGVEMAVALLFWLVELLQEELKAELAGRELEVIGVKYFGAYPALGIHCERTEMGELGPRIEAAVVKLLEERAVLDFVSYLKRTNRDWRKEAATILESTKTGSSPP